MGTTETIGVGLLLLIVLIFLIMYVPYLWIVIGIILGVSAFITFLKFLGVVFGR